MVVWSFLTLFLLATVTLHAKMRYLDGGALASGSEDGEVRLWSVREGTLLGTLSANGGSSAIFTLCALGGDRLVGGGSDGTIPFHAEVENVFR